MNCAYNASTKIKMINQDRDTEPGRGMSAHHIEKFGITREETSVIKDQFYRKNGEFHCGERNGGPLHKYPGRNRSLVSYHG